MGGRPRRKPVIEPFEGAIQAAVVEHWVKLGLPDTLVAAIPNANAHGQPGLTKGLADLIVLGPRVPGGVGFMELKRRSSSRVSDEQVDFGDLCARLGVTYRLAVGRDEPITILEAWAVVRMQAA
jgi:hypothetical protein